MEMLCLRLHRCCFVVIFEISAVGGETIGLHEIAFMINEELQINNVGLLLDLPLVLF